MLAGISIRVIDVPVPPPVITATSPSTLNILEGSSGERVESVEPIFEQIEVEGMIRVKKDLRG